MVFLKNWTIDLVIFITVINFLEMILPNGNMRKLVKMTVGLIVILVIISPFIKLVQGGIDIEKEILKNMDKKYEYKSSENNEFESHKDKQIKELYIEKIKTEIDNQIISKSNYRLNDIQIDIDEKHDTDSYGNIEKISMNLTLKESDIKDEKMIEKQNNIKDINIDIKLKDTKEDKSINRNKLSNDSSGDLNNMEKDISNKFQVDKEKIFIVLKTND